MPASSSGVRKIRRKPFDLTRSIVMYETVPASEDEKMFAMLAHFSGILLSVLGPWAMWVFKRDSLPFVDDQAREALNFQITILLAYVVCTVLALILPLLMLLYFPIWLFALIFAFIAGFAANRGERYRYPLTWRPVK